MLTTIYHELYQIKCWRHLEKQFHYPRGFPRWPSFKYSGGKFVFLFSQALEFQSTQWQDQNGLWKQSDVKLPKRS